ncbi:MAG TPA: hypothetical protein VHW72_00420 [Candidatus Angelobacter sp.]|jgi:hypothetical protein|nr:hypothetical protein [Candidatus Angelobacter sp.]
MNADGYPSGRPQGVQVPDELYEASSRLRQAMYRGDWAKRVIPKLAGFARTLKARTLSTREDEIYYLWSLCLQAEIYDYYGDKDRAREVLKEDGPLLRRMLEADELGLERDTLTPSKALLRQRLWALVFYAHCFYRDERYEEALKLLNGIWLQLERHLPLDKVSNPDEPSFGLRARVCYSRGQVKRQMSDIHGVRKEFMDAIEFTRQRLLTKMDAYPGEKYANVRLREQRYSTYFLAKANCFGLAWASYNSGELNRARAAAAGGCALLAATEDDLHKEYAQVMYAQILTAKTRPVQPEQKTGPKLEEAFEILKRLVEDKNGALRTIPKFLARAQYALASTLFASGKYDKAEAEATAIYRNTKEGSRWHRECMALLIRIFLKKGNFGKARDYSDQFLALTEKSESQNARAEAWLCKAEVLLKTTTSLDNEYLLEIDKALTKAEALWAANPLSTTICHLHRARLFVLKKNPSAARKELAFWKAVEPHIEQGYVHELARNVEAEIAGFDDDLLIISPQDLQPEIVRGVTVWGLDRVERRLRRWAIRYLFSLYGEDYLNKGNPQRILNRSDRRIREWLQDLEFDPEQGEGEDGGKL